MPTNGCFDCRSALNWYVFCRNVENHLSCIALWHRSYHAINITFVLSISFFLSLVLLLTVLLRFFWLVLMRLHVSLIHLQKHTHTWRYTLTHCEQAAFYLIRENSISCSVHAGFADLSIFIIISFKSLYKLTPNLFSKLFSIIIGMNITVTFCL